MYKLFYTLIYYPELLYKITKILSYLKFSVLFELLLNGYFIRLLPDTFT